MSEKISKGDVQGMFRRLCRAAEQAGVPPEEWSWWIMEEGSATYGRAWRLHLGKPGSSGQFSPMNGADSYLGGNRREAYLSLYGMARAFEAMVPAGVR